MAFGGRDDSIPDGYRRAKSGETPDMVMNGVPVVSKDKRHSSDNGISRGIFNRITGGQDEKYGDHDNSRRGASAAGLRNSENGATKGFRNNVTGDGAEGARKSEANVASKTVGKGGFFNSVEGLGSTASVASRKSIARRLTPIIAATCGISGFGILSFFGQMAMPFSLISQFQSNFDSIGTSNNYRVGKFTQWQMDTDSRRVKDCVKSRIFGADKFKITKKQRAKLAATGITVDDSGKFTVMKYKNPEGVEFTVVPDSRQATGDNTLAFKDMYENNQDFRDKYAKGSRTWRGAVGAWFDNLADKFLKRLGVSRGVWAKFKKGRQDGVDLDTLRSTIAAESGTNGKAKGGAMTNETNVETDEDSGEITGRDHTSNRTSVDLDADDIDYDAATGKIEMETPEQIDSGSGSKLSTKLKNFGVDVVGKVTGYATAAASLTCAALNVVGAINLIVAAYQTTQIIKVASSIFEAIQKGQVEDSMLSPLNEVANSLTMRTTSTYQYKDSNNNYHEETRTNSAMESEGVRSLFGNFRTNHNDASIRSFNLTNSIGAIATFLNIGAQSFKACAYAQLAASVVDAVKDAVDIVLCVISFGIGCLVDAAIDAIVGIGTTVAISLIVSKIVSILLPQIVKVLTRKIATEVAGEDLGNALVSGANMYMGQNHQFAGGSLADKDGLTRFLGLREEVNADNARIARETLSPFDYTSQYTFMGSLVSKMIPVTVVASNVTSSISSFGNVFSSSISSLMPGANAVSAAITAQSAADDTAAHCPDLDSIGAVGDAFCNPYFVTDTRTLDDDPAQVVNTVDDLGDNFEDEGGVSGLSAKDVRFRSMDVGSDIPKIKKGSPLAKYIVYCGQRQSPFGMADNNIAQEFQTAGATGSQVGDSIVGATPVVGDVFGAIQQEQVLLNYGYVSGEACVVNNVAGLNASYADWNENKEYQRFIEDQRLAENMGLIEKSSVTAFLEEYYEEHPIDNSYEGILARRSGLTKEQVAATLDIMEFIAWQETYDPSEYAPYVPEKQEETHIAIEDTEDFSNIGLVPDKFFEERRQRNFAV